MRRLGPQQQLASPGTAAAPGWSFTGYATSGLSVVSNYIALSQGGTVLFTSGPDAAGSPIPIASPCLQVTSNYQRRPAAIFGIFFGWNYSNGGAEANFYNCFSGASTAFTFTIRTSSGWSDLYTITGAGHLLPGTDGTQNLGSASARLANAYLSNNPTVSSDAKLKTLRATASGGPALSSDELTAWAQVSPLVWTFNADAAGLLHVGYIAQTVQAAFAAQGLDITKYALWRQDTLPDGSTRAALIYAECAVFEAAYQRQQVALLAKQLAALAKALDLPLPTA